MSHSLNELVHTATGTTNEVFASIVSFIETNTPLTADANGLWVDEDKTCGILAAHETDANSATFQLQSNATTTGTSRSVTVSSSVTVRVHVSTNETVFYIKIDNFVWVFAKNESNIWTIFESSTTANSTPKIYIQNSSSYESVNDFDEVGVNYSFSSAYKFIDLTNQVNYLELYKPITIQSGMLTNNGLASFGGNVYRFIKFASSYWYAVAFPVSDPA